MANITSPAGIRNLMEHYDMHPKKRFGQNFLHDKNILKKIADSCEIKEDEYLLEIGPGLGALTQELARRSRGVLAVDIDTSLETMLQESCIEFDNIKFLFQDILKVDVENELKKAFKIKEPFTYKICANIPYNITTAIIFHLFETCPHMSSATLMMQKEVGERLLASPGTKDYGRLTLTTAYYGEVESLINVSRNCFYPRPDVDSIVVRLKPHIKKAVKVSNELYFKNLLRVAFQKRRKTMLNICTDFFSCDKKKTGEILQNLGIKPDKRPENLNIQDFANLVNTFSLQEANKP